MTNSMQEDAFPDTAWLGANFAAVSNDGYGICYRFVGENKFVAHISSFKSAKNTVILKKNFCFSQNYFILNKNNIFF